MSPRLPGRRGDGEECFRLPLVSPRLPIRTRETRGRRVSPGSESGRRVQLVSPCFPEPCSSNFKFVFLTPTSIKFNCFLKMIFLKNKPLLACFGFVKQPGNVT